MAVTSMRAAVLHEQGAPLALEQVEVEPPREGEVLVRLRAAGVCHSDLSVARGAFPAALPCVLGHEGAGVVEEVGPGVRDVAPGDHVVMLYRAACGRCRYCVSGRPSLCPQGAELRRSGMLVDGSARYRIGNRTIHHFCAASTFAEYAVVPERGVMAVARDVPFEVLAVVGCAVMTGVGAVFNAAAVAPGESVAVIGCGGVGLSAVQGAAIAGATEIVAIDRQPEALELARALGATRTVRVPDEDALAAAREAGGGDGVDHALETAGSAPTIRLALDLLRPGGRAVAVGIPPHGVELSYDAAPFVVSEKTLRGCMYGSCNFRIDLPRVLSLYAAGRLRLDALVGRELTLDEVDEALVGLEQGGVARTVIRLGDG